MRQILRSTPARLAAFAVTLAFLFGGGALAGGAIDPDPEEPVAPHAGGGADAVQPAEMAERIERAMLAALRR